jgi:hypothetical protein
MARRKVVQGKSIPRGGRWFWPWQKEGQAAQAALAELCQIYWYPLYALSAEDVINVCV